MNVNTVSERKYMSGDGKDAIFAAKQSGKNFNVTSKQSESVVSRRGRLFASGKHFKAAVNPPRTGHPASSCQDQTLQR